MLNIIYIFSPILKDHVFIISTTVASCRASPEPSARVLTSWGDDSSKQWHRHQSYSRMTGLVWWQRRLSCPGAIPPAAGDHTHHLKDEPGKPDGTGEVFQSCSDTSRFLFPLIWLLAGGLKKLKHTKGLEKSGDRGNLSQWLKGYLYSSTSKPLIADWNRTRRSKEWFS